jgi:hypothetical protein
MLMSILLFEICTMRMGMWAVLQTYQRYLLPLSVGMTTVGWSMLTYILAQEILEKRAGDSGHGNVIKTALLGTLSTLKTTENWCY